MGVFRKLFGGDERARRTEVLVVEAGVVEDDASPDELVEIEVVGESYHQEVLERIAGPKAAEGKQHRVGATLRREPTNPYDSNAVRVEVLGQLVGHVARDKAAKVSAVLAQVGGVVEAQGLIVGGWSSAESEGSFGCRVWLSARDAGRLGLKPDRHIPTPKLRPPMAGEVRLSPALDSDSRVSTLTVTCEEHYQDAIASTRPELWNRDYWPVLVALAIAERNPHSGKPGPCIEVTLDDGATAGYLTPAMTERHADHLRSTIATGKRPTATALVRSGTKAGATIWRVQVTVSAD